MKKTLYRLLFICITLCLLVALLSSCAFDQTKTYSVSNDYFETASYSFRKLTSVSLQGGGVSEKPLFSISSQCAVSLFEYVATIYCYSADNECIGVKTIEKTKNVDANKTFTFDFIVDDPSLRNTVSIEVVFEGKSHEKPGAIASKHTVTFVNNNGQTNTIVKVKSGDTLKQPADPEKENYLFEGWYTNQKLTKRFSFSEKIESDLTLYAKYTIDAVSVTNRVSSEAMKGVVKITNKCYSTTSSGTKGVEKQGSGFCFVKLYSRLYFLTNCHVVEKDADYKSQDIVIVDYQGNEYPAYIHFQVGRNVRAISKEYDLACIYIELQNLSMTNIQELTLASSNPEINEDVISIGSPEKQSNFFTFGKVIRYANANLKSGSTFIHIPFEIIEHSAPADHGSSGGPLLNPDLEVVGINFGGSMSSDNTMTYEYTASIPIENIREFIANYCPQVE